ncbi:hypothetical protein WJX74_000469 [Apatococcus lobatus]|uniref:Thioredoxin reductase n=1 Tax=Apatococcus lobatus TaxID=904363 RepID=A0AAW1QBI1_9CHLO
MAFQCTCWALHPRALPALGKHPWASSSLRCSLHLKRSEARHLRRNYRRLCRIVNEQQSSSELYNLAVIGSGPAGYTAAIYAGRANLKPVVFEGYSAGGSQGGQLMTTTEVFNFPGFPEGITGPDLMDRMRAQADRWGAELFPDDVELLDLQQRPFLIRTSEGEYRAHSVIIATGATAKRLGIPKEDHYWANGISACAICDGGSPIFKNQELAVVGGGDTACEEAVYLTKYAKHVHLLVRGDKLRASGAMQDRTLSHDRITVRFHRSVKDATGKDKALEGLQLENTETGEREDLAVRGLFYGIGHQPNSSLVEGQLELDDKGYVKVHDSVCTSVEGVYAAGDLFDTEWRQAVTAAGSGCMAALSAERYLSLNDLLIEHHQQEAKAEQEKEPADSAQQASPGNDIDLFADRHAGQYALRKLYHASPRTMVVFYSSPTCGPCRSLKPVFGRILDEFSGKMHLVDIDIEQDPEIAEAAGVNGTPTIQIFKNKERIHHLPGVRMKSEYRKLITDSLS